MRIFEHPVALGQLSHREDVLATYADVCVVAELEVLVVAAGRDEDQTGAVVDRNDAVSWVVEHVDLGERLVPELGDRRVQLAVSRSVVGVVLRDPVDGNRTGAGVVVQHGDDLVVCTVADEGLGTGLELGSLGSSSKGYVDVAASGRHTACGDVVRLDLPGGYRYLLDRVQALTVAGRQEHVVESRPDLEVFDAVVPDPELDVLRLQLVVQPEYLDRVVQDDLGVLLWHDRVVRVGRIPLLHRRAGYVVGAEDELLVGAERRRNGDVLIVDRVQVLVGYLNHPGPQVAVDRVVRPEHALDQGTLQVHPLVAVEVLEVYVAVDRDRQLEPGADPASVPDLREVHPVEVVAGLVVRCDQLVEPYVRYLLDLEGYQVAAVRSDLSDYRTARLGVLKPDPVIAVQVASLYHPFPVVDYFYHFVSPPFIPPILPQTR
ncbi:hypothetical protein DRH14_01715 [Candidatus Shapirobacteria bacterium]|nr:MAG: hypothetical protein DRH14_01715 [Candidatus Shapirobacteria bacterium]